ncbi:unnamed protein product, partial [Protopolystoma xenopodis]
PSNSHFLTPSIPPFSTSSFVPSLSPIFSSHFLSAPPSHNRSFLSPKSSLFVGSRNAKIFLFPLVPLSTSPLQYGIGSRGYTPGLFYGSSTSLRSTGSSSGACGLGSLNQRAYTSNPSASGSTTSSFYSTSSSASSPASSLGVYGFRPGGAPTGGVGVGVGVGGSCGSGAGAGYQRLGTTGARLVAGIATSQLGRPGGADLCPAYTATSHASDPIVVKPTGWSAGETPISTVNGDVNGDVKSTGRRGSLSRSGTHESATEAASSAGEECDEPEPTTTTPHRLFTSRGVSTSDEAGGKMRGSRISALRTEKMDCPTEMVSRPRVDNRCQTSDDIILPAANPGVSSSVAGATAAGGGVSNVVARRMNLGGRYLSQMSGGSGNTSSLNSPTPTRSSWRQSVYGVDYSGGRDKAAGSATGTRDDASAVPVSESERRRTERERQLELDRQKQIQLEIERENRRLRQLERKARWEQDEAKMRELEEEIRRRKQATLELADEEKRKLDDAEWKAQAALLRQSSFRHPSQRRSGADAEASTSAAPDAIQKVADWQRQNSMHEPAAVTGPPVMSHSDVWLASTSTPGPSVSAARSDGPLLRRQTSAGVGSSHSQAQARLSRDSDATLRQTPSSPTGVANGVGVGVGVGAGVGGSPSEAPSAVDEASPRRGSYVGAHTDIDALLKERYPVRPEATAGPETMSSAGRRGRRDYAAGEEYMTDAEAGEDAPSAAGQPEETTLVYKSKVAKEIFLKMPLPLQNLVMRMHRRGFLTFEEVLALCRNENHERRFTEEEEKSFKGYKTAQQMLTSLGIDITKASVQ